MFFRITIFSALLTLMVLPIQSAYAKGNIAYVNMQYLLAQSEAMQNLNEQLQEFQEKRKKAAKKEDEELAEVGEELKKQRAVLAKDVFEERSEEFKKKVTEVQKKFQQSGQELKKAYNESLNKVQEVTLEIVAKISKKRGFDVVIPKSQLLYGIENLEITDEVLEELNDELSEVELNYSFSL